MKSQWATGRQRDFTGGENQAGLPEAIKPNQMIRMENAMVGPAGWLTDIMQTDVIAISNANLGFALVPQSGGVYDLYWSDSGKLYKSTFDTSSGTVLDVTTGTQTTLTQAYIKGVQSGVSFLGKYYCANPNPAASSNGLLNLTDKTFIAISGKITYKLHRYVNRLWVVNTDGSLMASDNGSATVFNALNILFLPNTDPIIDFIPMEGGAIVYGRNSVYAMFGSSYLDINFVPLYEGTDGEVFTSGAVRVGAITYIPGAWGMYGASLSGCTPIDHHQQDYFKANFAVFAQPATTQETIKSIYLKRFNSIITMWSSALGGTQGYVYNCGTNGFTKIGQLLPSDFPYMLALNDQNTDFIISMGAGYYAKSLYPSGILNTYRLATLQTRHEDCGSTKNKVFRVFSITTAEVVYGFSLSAYLDYSSTSISILLNQNLAAGENDIYLDLPRARTISMLISIDNQQYLTDENGNFLTDGTNLLTVGNFAANFTIKELKLKYREAGPEI